MSVYFSATQSPISHWGIECVCGEKGATADTYEQGLDLLQKLQESGQPVSEKCDEDCSYYMPQLTAQTEGPESDCFNIANGNVRPVLEALGLAADGAPFEEICCGTLPGEDFLGRVLIAQAVAPESAGRETEVQAGDGKATMISMGVDAGYVQRKLEQLRDIAEFAVAHGREVTWG